MLSDLHNKYASEGLEILAFPCSQFLNQAPGSDIEYLNSLKYVRPGEGFVAPFDHFSKVEVNGANRHPFWSALFLQCPFNPTGYIQLPGGYPAPVWSPMSVADVAWNFEKILIGRDGIPTSRYSSDSMGQDLEPEILRLLASSKF